MVFYVQVACEMCKKKKTSFQANSDKCYFFMYPVFILPDRKLGLCEISIKVAELFSLSALNI